ncbi:MAG: protein disulfide isomerase family protein [Patescibacteria group bacterium]
MKKQTTFIVSVVVIILFVIGLGIFMNKQSQAPSKYDDFAKALTSGGAQFYGAFWCPHCKEQKELFGNAAQYLPYVECSNPNQSVTQICKDEKIESYPTWKFKDGITLSSAQEPAVCAPKPGASGEPAVCQSMASQYDKTFVFPGYRFSIKSPTDPVHEGDVWTFPAGAATQGEVPMEFLAAQINYTLPQE